MQINEKLPFDTYLVDKGIYDVFIFDTKVPNHADTEPNGDNVEGQVKRFVVDHTKQITIKFRSDSLDAYYCVWSCPWIYLKTETKYEKHQEIIRDQRYPENDKYQAIEIPQQFIEGRRLKMDIVEELMEVSFIDHLFLEINEDSISAISNFNQYLDTADREYLVMHLGDTVAIEFKIPEHICITPESKILLWAKGYYIPDFELP